MEPPSLEQNYYPDLQLKAHCLPLLRVTNGFIPHTTTIVSKVTGRLAGLPVELLAVIFGDMTRTEGSQLPVRHHADSQVGS